MPRQIVLSNAAGVVLGTRKATPPYEKTHDAITPIPSEPVAGRGRHVAHPRLPPKSGSDAQHFTAKSGRGLYVCSFALNQGGGQNHRLKTAQDEYNLARAQAEFFTFPFKSPLA